MTIREYLKKLDRTVHQITGRLYLISSPCGLEWRKFPYYVDSKEEIFLYNYIDVRIWLDNENL
jgi:hypothetical protein